jgi:hypothetical protein
MHVRGRMGCRSRSTHMRYAFEASWALSRRQARPEARQLRRIRTSPAGRRDLELVRRAEYRHAQRLWRLARREGGAIWEDFDPRGRDAAVTWATKEIVFLPGRKQAGGRVVLHVDGETLPLRLCVSPTTLAVGFLSLGLSARLLPARSGQLPMSSFEECHSVASGVKAVDLDLVAADHQVRVDVGAIDAHAP